MSPKSSILLCCSVSIFLANCAGNLGNTESLIGSHESVDRTLEATLQYADTLWRENRSLESLTLAAQALERYEALESYEIDWRLSRSYLSIAARITRKQLQRKFLRRCIELSESGVKQQSGRPEAYAWLSSCRGLQATMLLAPGMEVQEGIEAPAEFLVENFPEYEDGLGHRILGALYAKAPPWPAGVGDLETARELHEAACALFPETPENLFFLGETYMRLGRRPEAESLFRRVLSVPRTGEWALVGASYRTRARQHLKHLRRGLPE